MKQMWACFSKHIDINDQIKRLLQGAKYSNLANDSLSLLKTLCLFYLELQYLMN